MNSSALFQALLARYVSQYSPTLLNQLVDRLPGDLRGQVFQALQALPADVDPAAVAAAPQDQGQRRPSGWWIDELMQVDFPDPVWTVPNLIPTGLVSLAGKPKVGKSWLALQLAIAVASGGCFLGERCSQAPVLYLAFEDPGRRLQIRINQLGYEARGWKLRFETEWRLLNNGGLDDLIAAVDAGDFKLVILDTFGRAVGQLEVKDYSDNVATLAPLQKLASAKGITILLIDHHSKLSLGENPIQDLIGSIGKAATFDALLGLYMEQGKRSAKLTVIGRDLEDKNLAVHFDGQTGCWQSLGDAATVRAASLKEKVFEAIDDLKATGELATTTRIAQLIGEDVGNTSRLIGQMLANKELVKLAKAGREQPYDHS